MNIGIGMSVANDIRYYRAPSSMTDRIRTEFVDIVTELRGRTENPLIPLPSSEFDDGQRNIDIFTELRVQRRTENPLIPLPSSEFDDGQNSYRIR